jgi:hypothetical protein
MALSIAMLEGRPVCFLLILRTSGALKDLCDLGMPNIRILIYKNLLIWNF